MVMARPIAVNERMEAPWPKTRPARRRASPAAWAPLGLCLFILLAANVGLYAVLIGSTLRISELNRRLTAAEEIGRQLELEIAQLSSYPYLVKEAEERLALRPTANGLVIRGGNLLEVYPEENLLPYGPQGLLATLQDYFAAFGRAAASIH